MHKRHEYRHGFGRLTVIAFTVLLLAALPAEAHHVMSGKMPTTLLEGFLSGLGHPIIGIDHLAFIVAVGFAAGMAGVHLTMPFLFIVVSALGVALHVRGINLPASEFVVATSVLLAGVLIARGVVMHTAIWLALFAAAGLFHGYAYGESIVGAEPEPLSAYLAGLVVVQAAIATVIAIFARRSGEGAFIPRLAGATIAGIGLATLAGQIGPV